METHEKKKGLAGVNIFSVVGFGIFFLTLAVYGGTYGYKNYLNNQIAKADQEINAARSAFQVEKIKELFEANSRILAIKSLLEKHNVSSEVLELLQELVIQNVRIDDFGFENIDGSPTITMNVEARSYNALAVQSDIFSKNDSLVSPHFSDFNLSESGNVTAKFFALVAPELVSYKEALEKLSLSPTQ